MTTDFSKKRDILATFYIQYRDDVEMKEFLEFNDIGLPLAYLASEGLCEINDDGAKYIAESWDLLLTTIGIEDTGFESLIEMFNRAEEA